MESLFITVPAMIVFAIWGVRWMNRYYSAHEQTHDIRNTILDLSYSGISAEDFRTETINYLLRVKIYE